MRGGTSDQRQRNLTPEVIVCTPIRLRGRPSVGATARKDAGVGERPSGSKEDNPALCGVHGAGGTERCEASRGRRQGPQVGRLPCSGKRQEERE